MRALAYLVVLAAVVILLGILIVVGYRVVRFLLSEWKVKEVVFPDFTRVYAVKYGETPDLVATVQHDGDFGYQIEEARSAARQRVVERKAGEHD